MGLASAPCSTVGRGLAAEKDAAVARPSRRSRARVEGRTNRAAGRAAYLAAMLCPMGGYGTGSVGPCKRFRERVAEGGGRLRCERATRHGELDLAPRRRDVEIDDPRGVGREGRQVGP